MSTNGIIEERFRRNRINEFFSFLESLNFRWKPDAFDRVKDDPSRRKLLTDTIDLRAGEVERLAKILNRAADELLANADLDPSNIQHLKLVIGSAAVVFRVSKPAGQKSKRIPDRVDFMIDVYSTMKSVKPKPIYRQELAQRYCAAKGVSGDDDATRMRIERCCKAPAFDRVPDKKMVRYRAAIAFAKSCLRGS